MTIKTVGIAGTGLIGAGWAARLLVRGYDVIAYDVAPAAEAKLRAAIVLHYYEGLTREEIADVLGVPAGTVASRIAKAVAIMRKARRWPGKLTSSMRQHPSARN